MKNIFIIAFFCLELCLGQEEFSSVFVVNGYNDEDGHLDSAELLDLNSTLSCSSAISPFPSHLDGSVALSYNGNVVICTGWNGTYNGDCYSYIANENRWSLEQFGMAPRSFATSVEIDSGVWMVMGGRYDGKNLDSTEIFDQGFFYPGPLLPVKVSYFSAVMLNATHMFIAAGDTILGSSQLNWLLDTRTMTFSSIACRTNSNYNRHCSGKFYNSTADEIQVAVVGLYGVEIWSPSQDTWHKEASFPLPLTGLHSSAAVQMSENYFILIGGHVHSNDLPDESEYSRALYRFDEDGLEVINENAIITPREYHVAISAPQQYTDIYC